MKTRKISNFVVGAGRCFFPSGWSLSCLAALAAAGTANAADVTSTWANPSSANWNVAGNWTNAPVAGGFPNNGNGGVATYDATINAAGGDYMVTLGTSVTVEDLLLNSGSATLSHTSGTFTATGGIALAAGNYQLGGGTISNTAITRTDGNLVFTSSAGILSNGTVFNGDLNLAAPNAGVRLFSGADFTGAANLSGAGSVLAFQETRTLTGKTLNLDGSNARLAIDGATTLTLGSGTLVRGRGTLGVVNFVGGANGLVNQGTIRADLAGQTLTVSSTSFTNQAGALAAATNGGTLAVNGSWSNAGQFTAANGSTLNFAGTWNNTGGTVAIDATSTLNLGGVNTAAGLGTIGNSAGGTVNLTGTINNTGASLTFSAATGSWQFKGGEISGGQITPGGGQTLVFTSSAGILSNGTVFNGDLNLAAPNAGVRLFSGADFTGAANLSGAGSVLAFQETRTLTGKTLNLDGSNARLAIDGATTLTLGSGTLVRGRGTLGVVNFVGGANGLVNQGTIRADLAGQTLTVSSTSFTNQAGALAAATNGGTLAVNGSWSNAGQFTAANGSTLNFAGTWNNTGGTVAIDATSTLNLGGVNTAAGLGTIGNSAGGTVNLTGTINNTGASLTFSAATGSWQFKGGEISGGQITPGGGQTLVFTSSAGILSNGTVFNGDLNLAAPNAGVRLFSGADFTGAANLSGAGSVLAFQETRTLTGKTLNLDGSNARLAIDGATTLTLGSGTLVRGRGTLGVVNFVGGANGLVNQGTIRADLAGQRLTISSNTFTNSGVVSAEGGGILEVTAGYIQTTGSTRVSGGTISTGNTSIRQPIRIDGGSIGGHGVINANVLSAGTIAPDLSSAAGLTINGTLTLAGTSVMSFDIGGLTKGVLYDSLTHTSATPVPLAGALAVQFANGFETCAHGADTFVLFTSSQNIEGTFANVPPGGRLATSDGHGSFKVHYGPASVFGPKTIVLSDYGRPVPGQFAAWIIAMGVPPGNAGAADDPDKDGLANAVEYALGLHPMQVQPQSALSAPRAIPNSAANPSLEFHFRMVNPQPPDLNLEVEAGASLQGPWQRIASKSGAGIWCGAATVSGAPVSGQIPVTTTDIQPIAASPKRFLRLRVTIAQP